MEELENLQSICTTKPEISKQHRFYNTHREQINSTRRYKYALKHNSIDNTIKINTTNKTKKPNDIEETNKSNTAIAKYYEKNPILGFKDLLLIGSIIEDSPKARSIIQGSKRSYRGLAKKTRKEPNLAKLLSFIAENDFPFENKTHIVNHQFIKQAFVDIPSYTLKRHLKALVQLKWLLRTGRGIGVEYYLNPFLCYLWGRDKEICQIIFEFAIYKIDFFDLLNSPFLGIAQSEKKIQKITVDFYKFENEEQWVKRWFYGIVKIVFTFEDGTTALNYLPVNYHASPKIQWQLGLDGKKHQSMNYFGFPHLTLPMKWGLFDVIESREYTTKGAYIHFDTSFKIFQTPENTIGLSFKKALEPFNTKNCEYVEVSDFGLLQKVLTERFVNNQRRQNLFNALGLKYTLKQGRPRKIISYN